MLAMSAMAAASCVEPYRGSWIEFVLGSNSHVPGDDNPGSGKPPSGTHYEMWLSTGGRAFHLTSFRIVKQVEPDFPCFIEDENSRFPGLHTTMWVEKNLEEVTADGSTSEPEGEAELGQMADAIERESNMQRVSGQLKAIVAYDPAVTPQVLAALQAEVDAQAPITATDDAANARRTAVCEAFFAAHPHFYVANDKVYSLPLSGDWYGIVEGTDPRNNGPVGGAGVTVPVSFEHFDYLWINWQFDDPNDPRISGAVVNDQGDSQGPYGPSAYGYHYMTGTPQYRTRRVITVEAQNAQFSAINATFGIYTSIGNDDVHF